MYFGRMLQHIQYNYYCYYYYTSRYSHPAASVSDPIYQTRYSSATDSTGLTPSESDQISRINNGMKGLAMKLPSPDSSPGYVPVGHVWRFDLEKHVILE